MAKPLRDKDGTPLIMIEEHILSGPRRPVPNTHHNLEISCVLQGCGQYRIADRQYDLQPGDIVILNNTEPHGLVIPDGETLRHLVVHFAPSFIWNSFSNAMDYNFLLVFSNAGNGFPTCWTGIIPPRRIFSPCCRRSGRNLKNAACAMN